MESRASVLLIRRHVFYLKLMRDSSTSIRRALFMSPPLARRSTGIFGLLVTTDAVGEFCEVNRIRYETLRGFSLSISSISVICFSPETQRNNGVCIRFYLIKICLRAVELGECR